MKKINEYTFEIDVNTVLPKVNELLANTGNVDSKLFSKITNKMLGDILISRYIVELFLDIVPLSLMNVNEIYTVNILGTNSMSVQISNTKNELDSGLIYNLTEN